MKEWVAKRSIRPWLTLVAHMRLIFQKFWPDAILKWYYQKMLQLELYKQCPRLVKVCISNRNHKFYLWLKSLNECLELHRFEWQQLFYLQILYLVSYILLYEFIGELRMPNWTPENKYFLNIIELQDDSKLQFVLQFALCLCPHWTSCVLLKDSDTEKIF